MPMILDGSNGITMPTWTTANRPTNPIIGAQGYNTTYGGVEVYNGSAWTLVTGGPAFSAYANSTGQSLTSGVRTKIQFNTKEFDTANCYDNATNYRFTPTVAGYYLITAAVQCGSGTGEYYIDIAKNGSQFKVGTDVSATATWTTQISASVYANGSTDYFEIYSTQSSGGAKSVASGAVTYFQATFVRGQ